MNLSLGPEGRGLVTMGSGAGVHVWGVREPFWKNSWGGQQRFGFNTEEGDGGKLRLLLVNGFPTEEGGFYFLLLSSEKAALFTLFTTATHPQE